MKSYFSRLAVVLAIVGSVAVFAVPASADLVHWYKFDDTGADNYTVTDSATGTAGDGTIRDTSFTRGYSKTGGALWTAEGKIGGALQFKSANKNGAGMLDGMMAPANTGSNSYTLSAWIKGDSFDAENTIFADYISPQSGRFLFGMLNGQLRAFDGSGDGFGSVNVVGTTTLSTNTWYHVAITNNDKAVTLYVNGNVEATGTFNHYAQNYSCDIGGMSAGLQYDGCFNGYIDDFRVYNNALTAGQVQSMVPEPSAMALSVCGMFGILAYAWRKRK